MHSMTDTDADSTDVRRLNFRYFERTPTGDLDVVAWALETLLELAHDFGDPLLPITGARIACPGIDVAAFDRAVDTVLDLADQVSVAEHYVSKGNDTWQAPRELCVDEYVEALRSLARLVRAR